MAGTLTQSPRSKSQRWYRPTVSPEHGVYVMLGVSFITGAAAAQQWTWVTTLALICAYCGFQAEHPLALQIKQRRSWKPRFLLWLGLYGGIACAIALWLYWHGGANQSLLPIYGLVAIATLIDCVSVWRRRQKSVWNELVTFAAVCLSAPLAYAVTTGTLSGSAISLWILNVLFFSSVIFTVKLRKARGVSVMPGLIFHTVSAMLVLALYQIHWLSLVTASGFAVAIFKYALVLWQKDWFCHNKIQHVAQLETGSSLLFLAITALSLLPAHLSSVL